MGRWRLVNALPSPTNEPVNDPVIIPLEVVIEDTINEPLLSVEPVIVKLPDMIAEPVYGNGLELPPAFRAYDAVMACDAVS